MQTDDEVSRRIFLERLAAGALLGMAGASTQPARAQAQAESNAANWTTPPVLENPNILVIMVDQMRPPMWLNSSQQAAVVQTVLPNIVGRIRQNSYNFENFFVSATTCTASRACLMTGLYAPQTAMYLDADGGTAPSPALNPAFPTWGQAVAKLNPAYQNHMWWFGKWHLSHQMKTPPLLPYGFQTRTYPGPNTPSPDGVNNEGTDGGPFGNSVWASDAMIADDFIGWIEGQAPTTGAPSEPWCATVSFVNPHDICGAPAWFQTSPFPPTNVTPESVYFPPPAGTPPAFYTTTPSPWNFENQHQVPNKPSAQLEWVTYCNKNAGPVTDWTLYLNTYFWLQNLVDQQVGLVLDALAGSAFADNTIVIFMSDHGEYAGSHGLRRKGNAVYDESLRVPFYVQFPGQARGSIAMDQMFSSVDFFGFICDLASGGGGKWRQTYPDLSQRQSLWSFLYQNSAETRVAPAPIGLPYIFHTFDGNLSTTKNHIVAMRTKHNSAAGHTGAKLAFYSQWAPCTTYPNSTPPDPEFYDYNPQTQDNLYELGNNYFSPNTTTQATLAQYVEALGVLGAPSTGLIASELNAPLVGTGNDGNPLSQAQAAAQLTYVNYMNSINGLGSCGSS